jgi:hypothetical protein
VCEAVGGGSFKDVDRVPGFVNEIETLIEISILELTQKDTLPEHVK